MLVAVAVVWIFVVAALFLKDSIAPSPTATIKRDFRAASDWVNNYRANHEQLPSKDEFGRFLMRENTTVPLEYERVGTDAYRLQGWDGENRWAFSSRTGRILPATE